MADDDELAGLLRSFGERLDGLERSLRTGTGREQERQVRRLDDEFSEEELAQLRETREYGRFRRLMDRYAEEIEQEAEREQARAADGDQPDDDEPNDDGDDADGDETDADADGDGDQPKPKRAKAKPKPRPKGGRHPQPAEDELPAQPPQQQGGGGVFSWLLRD